MKAIETRYKGYRFRSRLEARWAVFFDALNIKWTYEPEGFELGDGGRYLPDFFLPDIKLWIEIKPGQPTIGEARKARQLVFGMKQPLYISAGMPDAHGRLVWPAGDAEREEDILDCAQVSAVWSRGRATFHAYDGAFSDDVFVDRRLFSAHIIIGYSRRRLAALAKTNYGALDAARGSRFEFGEAA